MTRASSPTSVDALVTLATCYPTIVVDPPWRYPKRPGRLRELYDGTLTLEQIRVLPVNELAAVDAHLYLWATSTHLEHAWAIARAWKFRPVNLIVWAKRPHNLVLGFPVFPICTEYVLFCRRGNLPPLQRADRNWFQWPRGEHSQKPEAFLDMVEQISPPPRLEMFARRNRLGWDTYGNQCLEHVQAGA